MKLLFSILGCILCIPIANADSTYTSDFTAKNIEVETGSILHTDGYDPTCTGSGTGCFLIYGTLDARAGTDGTTDVTADGEFRVHGAGTVNFGTGGSLILTGSGANN